MWQIIAEASEYAKGAGVGVVGAAIVAIIVNRLLRK